VHGDIGVFVLGTALLVLRKPSGLQNAQCSVCWEMQVKLPLRSK
jgi:hypothetical protein